jgi:Fe-S cluster biosynthesis and repair protein YggX
MDARSRRYLHEQLEAHFFGGGAEKAAGFVPKA